MIQAQPSFPYGVQASMSRFGKATPMPTVSLYLEAGEKRKKGAWGITLIGDDCKRSLSGIGSDATFNRMYLVGLIKALSLLESPSNVTIYTSSQYIQKGLMEWIKKWSHHWDSAGIKHKDLWLQVHRATLKHTINCLWMPAELRSREYKGCIRLIKDALDYGIVCR